MTIQFIPSEDFDHLSSEDPLPALTRVLTEIWDDSFDALNHSDLESTTRLYEDFLFDVAPQIFTEILPRLSEEDTRVNQFYQSDGGALIFMDGMSIREMFPIARELEDQGMEVSCDFSLSTTPSSTLYYRKQTLGRENINSIDDVELIRTDQVDWLGGADEPVRAWCMVPDDFFDQWSKTRKSLGKPDRIYEESLDHLREILNKIGHDEVVVTSDHGYILPYAGSTRETPPEIKGLLEDSFENSREVKAETIDSDVLATLKEQSIVVENDGYASIVGRYAWGGGDRPVHGGVSLLETITPYMVIQR